MKFNIIFRKTFGTIFLVTTLAIGCKKETTAFIPNQHNTDPVLKIREIVGNHGDIIQLNKSHVNSYNKNLASQRDSNLKLLTIQEFRQLYKELYTIQYVQIGLDSNINTKKSFTEYVDDDYDDPGKPGLHKVQFYAAPFSYFNGTYGINNSNIPLAVLNLWYETDIHGKVIGTPQLFYTGISFLQTWTQHIVSAIQFSQNGYTSTFSLGGTTLYGINIYGQTIGWTNANKYIIKVSMDSNFGEDGKVSIIAEQN